MASWTYGLLGRSPDHVASFLTGLAMCPELFESNRDGFGKNLTDYYDRMRRQDLFACYVVVAPQGARNPEMYARKTSIAHGLQVTAEKDDGIILNGMKLLGTGAAFSDEIWVGNLLPLSPDQKAQAVTCAVPTAANGVSLWVRKPFEKYAVTPFDSPFSSRFDESDAVAVFDEVKVPWERVFLLDDVQQSREMYFRTPSHVMGNHQSIVRYHEKLKIILGFAYKAAEMNNVLQVPAVREALSKLAVAEAGLRGWIAGQIEDAQTFSPYLHINRRQLYAALNWCTNNYYQITESVREMLGAGPFLMPADVSALTDPALRQTFERYWAAGEASAIDRLKLMKLAWALPWFGFCRTAYPIRALLCRTAVRACVLQLQQLSVGRAQATRRRFDVQHGSPRRLGREAIALRGRLSAIASFPCSFGGRDRHLAMRERKRLARAQFKPPGALRRRFDGVGAYRDFDTNLRASDIPPGDTRLRELSLIFTLPYR